MPILAHMLAAEHVWLARLQYRTPVHSVWPSLAIKECQSLAAENAAMFSSYLAEATETTLRQEVRYRTTQGHEYSTAAADILEQVITHGCYHRGQIAKLIGQHGGTPINTDFITFARESI